MSFIPSPAGSSSGSMSAHSDRNFAARPTLPPLNEILPDHMYRGPSGSTMPSSLSSASHNPHPYSAPVSASIPTSSRAVTLTRANTFSTSSSAHETRRMRSSASPAPGGSPPRPGSASAALPLTQYPASQLQQHAFSVHRLEPAQGQSRTLQLQTEDLQLGHQAEHASLSTPAPQTSTDKPKPHQCSVCGAAFERPSAVQIHMRTHTHEKPFLCAHCGKSYPSSTNLNRHIRQVHGLDTTGSYTGVGARK